MPPISNNAINAKFNGHIIHRFDMEDTYINIVLLCIAIGSILTIVMNELSWLDSKDAIHFEKKIWIFQPTVIVFLNIFSFPCFHTHQSVKPI